MHFNTNPVPMMGLSNWIRGIATEEETFRTVREVVIARKKPVNAEGLPGFHVNRILLRMINEGSMPLTREAGNVEAIGMKLGAN